MQESWCFVDDVLRSCGTAASYTTACGTAKNTDQGESVTDDGVTADVLCCDDLDLCNSAARAAPTAVVLASIAMMLAFAFTW